MTVAGIATSPLSELEHRVQLRRAVIASTIGTTIEWYDFFLYSTVTGLVFAKLYFPGSDPLVGTLQAFGIYAVGFVARPVGAAIFGHYGDRIGRKAALIATLLLMGIATFLVAFVPTYAQIGVWGAIILTVLRFVQGIGVGGEWGGSVLLSMEWARSNHHRGFIAAWPQFGVPAGLFLANLAALAFSAIAGDQFLGWGWRIPFFLSITRGSFEPSSASSADISIHVTRRQRICASTVERASMPLRWSFRRPCSSSPPSARPAGSASHPRRRSGRVRATRSPLTFGFRPASQHAT